MDGWTVLTAIKPFFFALYAQNSVQNCIFVPDFRIFALTF